MRNAGHDARLEALERGTKRVRYVLTNTPPTKEQRAEVEKLQGEGFDVQTIRHPYTPKGAA